jgi:hypothetical protein
MKPQIEGKTIMGTCHSVTIAPQWRYILCRHNWDHEQKEKKSHGHLPPHDHCTTMMIDSTNAYTKWKHEQEGKNYGHLLQSHHGQCCLVISAYTKLDHEHEHEHDQENFWALINVWLPHHNDDLTQLSAYTKGKSRPTMNTQKTNGNGLWHVGSRPAKK